MYIKKRINDKYSKDSEVGKFKITSVSPPGLVFLKIGVFQRSKIGF